LAVADEHVGDMLAKSGNPEEGLRNLRRSLATYEDLSKAAPSNMTFRSDTAAAHLLVGEALLGSGNQADAVNDYRMARQLYASLVRDDPQNEQYQVDLDLARERLSIALQKGGQLSEARQVTVDLLAGLRPRVEREAPSSDDILQYCWVLLTTPFKDLANPQVALRLAQKAVELTKGSDPGKLNVLALAWEANGDLSRAIETEQRALKATQAGTKRDEIEANLARFERLRNGLR
jgi:tetratricopeptide (TPR) repeat protein